MTDEEFVSIIRLLQDNLCACPHCRNNRRKDFITCDTDVKQVTSAGLKSCCGGVTKQKQDVQYKGSTSQELSSTAVL